MIRFSLTSPRAAATVLVAAALCASSLALASEQGPKKIIDDKNKEIHAIIKSGADEEAMRAKIVDLMESFVDYGELSRLTIKDEWETLAPEKRAKFVDAFKKLIHRTYTRRFKANQAFSVDFQGEPLEREGRAQVRTTIHSGDTTADVFYSMFRPAEREGWWVYDIVIDDVSMMRNYRTQFTRVIKKDGFDKLLERIEKKAGEQDTDSDDI
jgi:phospholipid transport system substrate-binding protein